MKMKFRSKMLIPTLTIIILSIVALQSVIYYESSKVLEQEIFNGISRNASEISNSINNWYKARITDFKTWTLLPQVSNALKKPSESNSQQVKEFLKLILDDYDYFSLVFIADKNGKAIHSSDEKIIGTDVSSRHYFSQVMKTRQAVISEPVISKLSGLKVSALVYPIITDGKVMGILVGTIKLSTLKELFTNNLKIGKSGYAYVINDAGVVILHPNSESEMKLDISKYEFGRYMIEKKVGIKKYWWAKDNAYKGQAFNEIKSTGWIVAVTCPLSDLLANLSIIKTYAIIGGILVVILVGVYLNWLIGSVATLINTLVAQLKEIAIGDVTNDVNPLYINRADEFGEMATSFQTMIEAQRQKSILAEDIADGNLTHEVEVLSENDSLGKALYKMNQKLNEIISQIKEASVQVSTGSTEMADASQSLSQGATEQAASLEEISSSVSEIASQSKANAENASQASQLSVGTREEAEKGSQDVKEMLDAMDDINKSSQEIAKIIKAIDDIAFQTNILALNAAVEAARAGTHGKGFAVVADEVRTLAGRSAKAASETAELIDKALKNAEHGQNVAERTSNSFKNIVDSIIKFSDITSEIASASNEQASGVSQINVGLSQVDQVTQTNTANAEETASVAEELASQSTLMNHLLTYFSLNTTAVATTPQTPQPVPPQPVIANKTNTGPATPQEWGKQGTEKKQNPQDIISLEDSSFGRY